MPTRTIKRDRPAHRKANTGPTTPIAENQKTASSLIRDNSRETLKERFGRFLKMADSEEIQLLESILSTWDSGIADHVKGVDEIPLAEAFEFELGRAETYIRVPRKLLRGIEGHILASDTPVDLNASVARVRGQIIEGNLHFPNNEYGAADAIQTARAVYRLCPEAILTHNKGYENKLRKLAQNH